MSIQANNSSITSISQMNRGSTTNEKSYQQQLSDEIEKEVRAALELIHAQF